MKRTASALTVALALMASIVLPMPLANANFVDFPIPSMGIISPPYPPNKYENSTVMLEIHVYMLNDSPRIRRISYVLDSEPPVYLYNFTTLGPISWRQGYIVSAKVDLENLSEGNHTVKAYSVDVNGKEMSTSQSFTVSSHYAVTVLRVLSPTNQTYSTREIPLIFAVNGEFKNASYQFLEPSDPTRVCIAGNTTLTGLSDGFNKIAFTVDAENGIAGALLSFTIDSTLADNQLLLTTIAAVATLLVIVMAGILYKRKKIKVRN
jgi:hypothetical protein